MLYVAVRDCYGFRNRYWHAGETVDIDAGEVVPRHFEPVAGEVPAAPPPPEPPGTFSELNAKRKESVPNSGMAYDPSKPAPVRGRGRPKKTN